MRATVMYGAGDVRVEDVADARLLDSTDALVQVTRRDLRQRSLAVEVDAARRCRPADGARVHRRRRGGRLRGRDHEPGRVFDRTGSIEDVPEGYRAMNDREVLKFQIKP